MYGFELECRGFDITLHDNKYVGYFLAKQMVIVSGSLTFVWVQARDA